MSNFSSIGIYAENKDELIGILDAAMSKALPVPSRKDSYLKYTDASGCTLWFQLDSKGNVMSVNPHFEGKSRREVNIMQAIPGAEGTLDIACYAWADPNSVKDESEGAYPFLFEVPDYYSLQKMILPHHAKIQLTAFTQEIAAYKTEQAYYDAQKEEPKYGPNFFIPSGLFVSSEKKEDMRPYALFAGKVEESNLYTNTLTEEQFCWLLVESLAGPIDVVAPPEFLNELPEKGDIISGNFWMSAQLIDAPRTNGKKNLFQRLFN